MLGFMKKDLQMFVFICILLTVGSSDIRLSHLHSPYVPSFRIRFHDLTHSRRQYENFRSRGRIHLSEIRSTQCRKGKRPVTAYILVFSVSLSCTSMHPLTHSLSLSLSLCQSLVETQITRRNKTESTAHVAGSTNMPPASMCQSHDATRANKRQQATNATQQPKRRRRR